MRISEGGRLWGWAFAALLSAISPAAQAQEGAPVTLRSALLAGAKHGPAVTEAERVRMATDPFANHPGVGLPSVPQVTLLAGARSPNALPVGPEVSLSATQEISLRGLGSARSQAAAWAGRAATSEVERARLEGAALAALSWINLLEAQTLMEIRAASVLAAEQISKLAVLRVTSGVATAIERSLAQAELGSARVDFLDAEGRATEARLALAYAMGAPMDRDYRAEGTLDAPENPSAADDRALAGLDTHPTVMAAHARAEQSKAEGQVVRAANGPTFSVGASVWREGSGDKAAAGILSFPLPFFDPSRYDTARQETLAAAARGHEVRLRAELERELRLAMHERVHTREVRSHLRSDVVKPLRSAVDTAMASYSAGTASLETMLLARRAALAAEERLARAKADVERADLRASTLAGSLLRGAQP
ncbi:MAG: TolC family protein [Polyangiaceae bacterium]